MARRHPKSKSSESDPVGVSQTTVSVHAVVWVDSAPLLKAEKTKLRAAQKKLSVVEERVRLHQQSDEPGYQKWFTANFAERVAEIRELYEKLGELDAVVWKVEREILATGCSAFEAYERVTAEDAEAVETEEETSPEESADEPDGADSSDESGDDEATEFHRQRRAERDDWKPKEKAAKPVDETIKQIYRQLVRKLHPDLNPDLPKDLKERWFDVQQAYDDRDLSRLEALLATCEEGGADEERFIEKIQSLTRLKALIKSVSKKLKTSQRQLMKLKTAPSWDFHKARKDPRRMAWLERDVKFELRNAEESLEGDIRTLEAQIKKWKTLQDPRRGRRNRRSWDLQFDY